MKKNSLNIKKGGRWRFWWNSFKTFWKEKFWKIFYGFFNLNITETLWIPVGFLISFRFLGKMERTVSFLFVKNSVSGIIWLFLQWHSLWRCRAVLKLWIKTVLREENIVVVFLGKKIISPSNSTVFSSPLKSLVTLMNDSYKLQFPFLETFWKGKFLEIIRLFNLPWTLLENRSKLSRLGSLFLRAPIHVWSCINIVR